MNSFNRVFLGLGLLALLSGCATGSNQVADGEGMMEGAEAPRYLAWLEGGLGSGYKTDSGRVSQRLAELEKSPPALTDKDAYLEYVSLLDAAGKYKVAGEKIHTFIGANPADGRGAFLLAIHFLRLKKGTMAQYLFEKLEKDPKYAWRSLVYNNLGMMALDRSDRYAAMDYFEKATKAQPPLAAPLVNLGALYLQSHSYSDAEKVFYTASQLDRGLEDAIVGRGVALEAMGQFEKAHDVYADYLNKDPQALAVLYNDSILLGKRLNQPQLAAQQMLRYVQKGGKETARAQELIQSWR